MAEYDVNDAVRFINATLMERFNTTYPAEEIIKVLDIIFDWYDADDSEDDFENNNPLHILYYHVISEVRKNVPAIDPDHAGVILLAELNYEDLVDPENEE